MSVDWSLVQPIGIGVGVLLVGVGIFIVCLRLAAVLTRSIRTLDVVDKQLGNLSAPVAETLTHVGGIADTADTTIARLGVVVGSLEAVAGAVGKTAALAGDALGPTIVNVGSTLAGVSAGLRRLTRGRPADETVSTNHAGVDGHAPGRPAAEDHNGGTG